MLQTSRQKQTNNDHVFSRGAGHSVNKYRQEAGILRLIGICRNSIRREVRANPIASNKLGGFWAEFRIQACYFFDSRAYDEKVTNMQTIRCVVPLDDAYSPLYGRGQHFSAFVIV